MLVKTLNVMLKERDAYLNKIKQHLSKAQPIMKIQADKKMRDVTFEVDD